MLMAGWGSTSLALSYFHSLVLFSPKVKKGLVARLARDYGVITLDLAHNLQEGMMMGGSKHDSVGTIF